jgi:hypothetical protein
MMEMMLQQIALIWNNQWKHIYVQGNPILKMINKFIIEMMLYKIAHWST